MSTSTSTKTFFFATVFDSGYGNGSLYDSSGSRIEMKDRGPFPDYRRAEDAPEVEFSDIEYGRSYWECASLPAGRYWHINRELLDKTLQMIEVTPSGWGKICRVAEINTYTQPHDVLQRLRDKAVPRWVQDHFLGDLPYHTLAKIVERSGRPSLERLYSPCFTRTVRDGVWMYRGECTIVADLIRGRVIDGSALPRRIKKALGTPPRRRTSRQKRRVARIGVGPLGRWSGGFRVEDAIDNIAFDDDLQDTFDSMSKLMDGGKLIEPAALFGGIKYTILECLVARGHLSYRDAYTYVAKRFGSDDRLDMPVGTYDYDLLCHWAWKDIAFKVRRAAQAASQPR